MYIYSIGTVKTIEFTESALYLGGVAVEIQLTNGRHETVNYRMPTQNFVDQKCTTFLS